MKQELKNLTPEMVEEEHLKCLYCDKEDETVQSVEDPYAMEICGETDYVDVCSECLSYLEGAI